MSALVHYQSISVSDPRSGAPLNIFYREAGHSDAPVILLLHGFPTSSHQYRGLIERLSDKYRVIAPDLPGFGFSDAPAAKSFGYTFDHLAEVMESFTDAINLSRYALYVFDYGAPVGFRLAKSRPDSITALISQNGNAYEEGLSEGWNPIRAYWQNPTEENRSTLRTFLQLGTTQFQYNHGEADATLIAPESYTLDQYFLDRPGNDEIQLDLFGDYKTNVAAYPRFHEYFRTHQPPTLAVWGRNDPFSCLKVQRHTGVTFPVRRYAFWRQGISPLRRIWMRWQDSFVPFLPKPWIRLRERHSSASWMTPPSPLKAKNS